MKKLITVYYDPEKNAVDDIEYSSSFMSEPSGVQVRLLSELVKRIGNDSKNYEVGGLTIVDRQKERRKARKLSIDRMLQEAKREVYGKNEAL